MMPLRTVLPILLLLAASTARAAEAPRPAPQREESARQTPTPQPRRPAAEPSYTPSEKISADSAVAFPVDI